MKKLITLLLATFWFQSNAQNLNDSLMQRIKNDEQIISNMSANLDQCHSQFRTGVGFLIFGTIGTGVGAFAFNKKTDGISEPKDDNVKNIVLYGSAVLTLVGTIIIIDSHKWIGVAGGVSVGKNGLTIGVGF